MFLGLVAGRFLERGSITLREREIVIDRTCARCGSEYEWGDYRLISFVTNAFRIPLEPYAARFDGWSPSAGDVRGS